MYTTMEEQQTSAEYLTDSVVLEAIKHRALSLLEPGSEDPQQAVAVMIFSLDNSGRPVLQNIGIRSWILLHVLWTSLAIEHLRIHIRSLSLHNNVFV
jgi:hypothetical protein